MKNNPYYNINGYLNTASLLREKILSDEYSKKSTQGYKRNVLIKQGTIDTDSLTLPSVKSENRKLNGFNYNFEEFLKRRKSACRSIDKAIVYENRIMKERIRRISSPLSREAITKDYDEVYKPVLKRIMKVYPNETLHMKIQKMQQKVKVLKLK